MVETVAAGIAPRVRLAASDGELDYFRMTGADLKAEAESGNADAAAEIARRKGNRVLKAAAKKAAAAA